MKVCICESENTRNMVYPPPCPVHGDKNVYRTFNEPPHQPQSLDRSIFERFMNQPDTRSKELM